MKSWEMFGIVLTFLGMLIETIGTIPMIFYYLCKRSSASSPPSGLNHFGVALSVVGISIVLFCEFVLR